MTEGNSYDLISISDKSNPHSIGFFEAMIGLSIDCLFIRKNNKIYAFFGTYDFGYEVFDITDPTLI